MHATSVTIRIPASDLDRSRTWYDRLLGHGAEYGLVPGIVMYEVAGITVQLVHSHEPGGHWMLRIGVADLGAERARLRELGIETSDIRTIAGAVSYFHFHDPDGNRLSCYRPADTAAAGGSGG